MKVLILTTFDDDEYVSQAMRFGARGYLLKDTPLEPLANAIRSVNQGHTQLGPGLFEKVMTPLAQPPNPKSLTPPPGFTQLTRREREVLRLIAAGASNREIAESLHISERTVKNHMTSILTRLNLRDRAKPLSIKAYRTQTALLANSFLPLLDNFESRDISQESLVISH